MNDHQGPAAQAEGSADSGDSPPAGRSRRSSMSPRLTYLLIGGAALGLIALMCLIVALIAVYQNS